VILHAGHGPSITATARAVRVLAYRGDDALSQAC
jgi:hypothetical protein